MNATSTLLHITHRTLYRYAERVTFLPHRLVLRPREGHDLRVEQLTLNISPPCELTWSRDVFGNSIAQACFAEPADRLEIENDVVVRRFRRDAGSTGAPVPAPSLPAGSTAREPAAAVSDPSAVSTDCGTYPVCYDTLEQPVVASYVAPVFPEDATTIQTWLRADESVPARADSAEAIVLRLTVRVHDVIAYRRREEKGVQSPATTLTMGTGSCRDLATLLMESLRHLGLAARFASGYLDCRATRAAQGSTHAWTEVYFPDLGWRGYDPTTGNPCTHQHIVTGVSNHPRGVMPVSGKYFGPGSAFLGLDVNVTFAEARVGAPDKRG